MSIWLTIQSGCLWRLAAFSELKPIDTQTMAFAGDTRTVVDYRKSQLLLAGLLCVDRIGIGFEYIAENTEFGRNMKF